MLRVMLVDDEPLALEGLALLIDWKKEGFSVCACCTSGTEALEALSSTGPQLIVTDIHMQDMDGLELMASAREQGYEGAFIAVSGYSDFEYAQKAMRIGVAGYLLKPIDPKEASQVLEHVRKELIDKELKHKLPLATYQQAVTELLMGQSQKHQTLPQGVWQLFTWGVPLAYDVVAAILDGLNDTGIQATTHIVDGKEWLVLYAKDSLDKASIDALRQTLLSCRRELMASPEADTAERLMDLRLAMCAQLDDSEAELIRRLQEMARAVSLLQHETFHRLADELQSFYELRGNAVRTRAYELFHALCGQQLTGDSDKLGRLLYDPARDIKALGQLTMHLLTPDPKRLSDRVKAYLSEHYGRQMTLETVSAALGYNATYLGRVFREETGIGFRDFLNDLRIQKAAQMLAASSLPVHQISDAVGYMQYKQFLTHFKQSLGLTPKEYRKTFSP